jgi:hypothetical protein
MKKGLCVLAVLFVCVSYPGTGECFAQRKFAFGVKPGMTMQTSYFGFTAGNLLPYASMDLLWMTVNLEETSGGPYDSNKESFKGKAFLLIPHFGSKLYIHGAGTPEGLRAYLNGDLYFSIPSVSIKEDGMEVDDEGQELIEDVLSFWGFNLGFGTEYMFSEHFSIGGEYGFRIFFDKIKQEGERSGYYYDPDYGYRSYQEKWEEELSLTLKMNYAVVALNFYF